jgi:hypothetical protein
VGYDKLRANLGEFDRLLTDMKLSVKDDSPLKTYLDTTREFLADQGTLGEDALFAKWNPRFKEFYQAQFVVGRLAEAANELKGLPRLKETLKKVIAGSTVQDFQPDQAKDFLYELELAADLKRAGFTVALREPDIVIEGNGLSGPLAIAGKYPSSRQQLHAHISKGYQQIAGQGLDGVVSIGLDLIVFGKEAGLGAFIDFNQGSRDPMVVLQDHLSTEVDTLVRERARVYPSERPIDGLMLTLTPGGVYGKPAQMIVLCAAALRCNPNNPKFADLGLVRDSLMRVNPVPPTRST